MRLLPLVAVCCIAITCLAPLAAFGDSGRFSMEKFRAPSLEGNFLGDSPDREISVYLPPSYETSPTRRYPVVYFLHGNNARGRSMDFTKYFGDSLPGVVDKWIASGATKEMIIVFPNSSNRYGGSQYANSDVSGRWADFIVRDVVSYIDKRYRTLAKPESRGLSGNSMGGRGVLCLALQFPGVYGAVYATAAGSMGFNRTGFGSESDWRKVLVAADDKSAVEAVSDPALRRLVGFAVAFSPNRNNPPFYADFPIRLEGDVVSTRSDVANRWAKFDPVQMAEKDASAYRELRALHFDCGTADRLITVNRLFSEVLTRQRIRHTFEEHDGDHHSRFVERIPTKVLPMFSHHLVFE